MYNVEEKAASMGWVPQEEWKGSPDKWRPAEEFVERGENIIPILKDRLTKLEDELKMTLKVNKAEIDAVKKVTLEQAKKDYEKQIDELRKQKFEAVQVGDVKEFAKIEQQEKSLKAPEEIKPEATPVFEDWRTKNAWYQKDEDLTDFAEFVAAKLHKTSPGMEEKAFYETVASKVKANFPEKFKNMNREKDDLVSGGSNRATGGKGKTFSDLPESAKATYARMAKKFEQQGRKLDKDNYAKEYFEE